MSETSLVAGVPSPVDPALKAVVEAMLFGEDVGPATIGRFNLVDKIGEGGMGTVWSAYDPELDRKVAVKLLRADREVTEDEHQRVAREAKAMAKLSHPNVAQIYEVGEHEGATYIALEFVAGETLRKWQQERHREWRRVVDVYLQAAEGLAAAHAAGLVHRDFKPDNAMIDGQGRVRVLDFGLARSGESTASLERPAVTSSGDPIDSDRLTRTGSIVGTPAYMAPEQMRGEVVDARADQFALCVALWEALYGERPFAGDSRASLFVAVTEGELREPPAETEVPTWVHETVRRGLQTSPEQRHASVAELIAALRRDPTVRRRRLAIAAAAGVVGLAGLGGRQVLQARAVAACEAFGSELVEVWDDVAREEVRAAGSDGDTIAALDRYAADWKTAAVETCVARDVDATFDPGLADKAAWCLGTRRRALVPLVDALRGSKALASSAIGGSIEWPTPLACRDGDALRGQPAPPDAASHSEAVAVDEALARVAAQWQIGSLAPAREAIAAALASAEALGYDPLVARAMALEGALAVDAAGSEASTQRAFVIAFEAGDWATAARAAIRLATIAGVDLERPREGQDWLGHAEVATTHAGDPGGLLEADRRRAAATLAKARVEAPDP